MLNLETIKKDIAVARGCCVGPGVAPVVLTHAPALVVELEAHRELVGYLWDALADQPVAGEARVAIARIYVALGEDLGDDEDGDNIIQSLLSAEEITTINPAWAPAPREGADDYALH